MNKKNIKLQFIIKKIFTYINPVKKNGFQQWNPHEIVTLFIGVTLVLVSAGWLATSGLISASNSNNSYVENQNPLEMNHMMHISPLTIDNFAVENSKIIGPIARPPNNSGIDIIEHQVSTGESLWSIARQYNITIDTLLSANPKYKTAQLHPNIILRVPSENGMFYRVSSGDTLDSIARRFSVQGNNIMLANVLTDPSRINVNQELFIPGAKPNVTLLANRNTFIRPIAGRISSGFGNRQHPMGGGTRFHRGVDFAAQLGTTIVAARDGRVVHAGWYGLLGKTVIIRHNREYVTYYAHCSRILVREGQQVRQGQAIARVGSTGRSTGPHLHFEIRRNGVPINPMRYIR